MSAQNTPNLLAVNATGCLYNKAAVHQHAEPLKLISPWIEDAWEGDAEAAANMRRIAACWNACDSLPTEFIEKHGITRSGIAKGVEMLCEHRDALLRERTELLAALEKATAHIHPDSPDFAECERLIVKHGGGK